MVCLIQIRKEKVKNMSSLGQRMVEKGAHGLIMRMYRKGLSVEQMA